MYLTIHELAAIIGNPTEKGRHPDGFGRLLTDSRSLQTPEDTLFFALAGTGNDGHRYIAELYDRGVRGFVVDRQRELPELEGMRDVVVFRTDNVLAALQRVGSRARQSTGAEIVAITGSRGKTTLKEWLYQLIEPRLRVSRSPRSWNSQIGVPLSLWEIASDAQLAIVEAGISQTGEMDKLQPTIDPDTVIFTNIGPEHDEGFCSSSQKASEKALLARSARCVIYNCDSTLLAETLKDCPAKQVTWSLDANPQATVRIHREAPKTLSWQHSDGRQGTITIPSDTAVAMENAANALTLLLSLGWDAQTIAGSFSALRDTGTRLNVTEGANHCSIVADSYTSDTATLSPALDFLHRHRAAGQAITAIISDPIDSSEIPQIARIVAQNSVKRFIGIGKGLLASKSLFAEGSCFFADAAAMLKEMSPSDFSNEIILIKGTPEAGLEKIASMLQTRTHETVLEVNLDALVTNYNYFRSKLPAATGLICMVKASAYGAGSIEIARTLQDAGAAYLAVAVLDEGIQLRQNGITMPIMVMNPKVQSYRQMFENKLEPEIYSLEMLGEVVREARKNGISQYPIHIKFDTGMHRMGFIEEELPGLSHTLRAQDSVRVKSVFTHLATADCLDMDSYTLAQLELFEKMTSELKERLGYSFMRHALNSAGILRFPQYHYDMARLGIGLYGADTLPPDIEAPLAIVSTLRTPIIALRSYPAGTAIGYGRKGILRRQSTIATIPIGYADGMNRHFSNGALSVWINGHYAPTIGNVCMDACMIDVTGIDCAVGDSVEIFGNNAPLQRLADILGTIPYEILTSVSDRVKRIYYRE